LRISRTPFGVTFTETLAHWHDFYLAAGGAAATLAGLLFVALSLHLRTVVSQPDVRALASVTLTDFVCVMVIALVGLIPTDRASTIGFELLVVGVLNLPRTIPIARAALARGRVAVLAPALLLRRFGLSLACYLALIAVGAMFLTGNIGDGLGWLVGVLIALLLTALRNTWDLLVTVADSDQP
jgi:hypothetical protein